MYGFRAEVERKHMMGIDRCCQAIVNHPVCSGLINLSITRVGFGFIKQRMDELMTPDKSANQGAQRRSSNTIQAHLERFFSSHAGKAGCSVLGWGDNHSAPHSTSLGGVKRRQRPFFKKILNSIGARRRLSHHCKASSSLRVYVFVSTVIFSSVDINHNNTAGALMKYTVIPIPLFGYRHRHRQSMNITSSAFYDSSLTLLSYSFEVKRGGSVGEILSRYNKLHPALLVNKAMIRG